MAKIKMMINEIEAMVEYSKDQYDDCRDQYQAFRTSYETYMDADLFDAQCERLSMRITDAKARVDYWSNMLKKATED